MPHILVTGATGQIGSELVPALRSKYGNDSVVITVNKTQPVGELAEVPSVQMDVTDRNALEKIIQEYKISEIYHLVGVLSATGERDPNLAWKVNMESLKHVLDLAVEYKLRVFWPSSIAAFGPTTPQDETPQHTILEPTTMYGVTKVAGELLCQYYWKKFGLDVRSLRYPGIISYKTPPGGGTTDYAVAIFYEALKEKKYTCFVREDTVLPMMYMSDAVKATLDLMDADASKLTVRTSYNLTAMSFSVGELAREIQKHMPEFTCTYEPDFRQNIADSWPRSIDDSQATKDWGWKPEFRLSEMTKDMIQNLKEKI